MSGKRPPEIFSSGRVRFISVATKDAVHLREYLRLHGIHCEPPEPYAAGRDSIRLGATRDDTAVQCLLDLWE
jgi:hypothetical protein